MQGDIFSVLVVVRSIFFFYFPIQSLGKECRRHCRKQTNGFRRAHVCPKALLWQSENLYASHKNGTNKHLCLAFFKSLLVQVSFSYHPTLAETFLQIEPVAHGYIQQLLQLLAVDDYTAGLWCWACRKEPFNGSCACCQSAIRPQHQEDTPVDSCPSFFSISYSAGANEQCLVQCNVYWWAWK